MKRAASIAAALALVFALSGCEIADKIPLTPKEALRAADTFGTAVRERLDVAEQGTTYRTTIESRRPASWLDANRAISRQIPNRCPEGQRPDSVVQDPVVDFSTSDDQTRMHPAGTVFTLTVKCPGRPHFEFDLAPGTTEEQATDELYRRLRASGFKEGSQPVVYPVLSWEHSPKYEQVERLVGSFAYSRALDCPEGVVTRSLTIGNLAPGTAKDEFGPTAYIGLITECVGARPLAPPSSKE